MVEFARHHHLFQMHQGRQWHHRIPPAADKNLFYAIGAVATFGIGLHHHVVLLAIAFELRDSASTHDRLYRAGDGVNRHAQVCGSVAVYF